MQPIDLHVAGGNLARCDGFHQEVYWKTTYYLAFCEDHEGCGFQTYSLHLTEAGAKVAAKQMILEEEHLRARRDGAGRRFADYAPDELFEWLDEERGHSGGVQELTVRHGTPEESDDYSDELRDDAEEDEDDEEADGGKQDSDEMRIKQMSIPGYNQ